MGLKIEEYYNAREDFGLTLEYCGLEYCDSSFHMPTHQREVFLLHYVFRGGGTFQCGDTEYPLRAGDLFAIFPGQLTAYHAERDDPFCFCWVGFTGSNAARMLERCNLHHLAPVCHLSGPNGMVDLVEQCIQLCTPQAGYDEVEMQGALYGIFHCIERHSGAEAAAAGRGPVHEHVQLAKSYIRFNYMSPLTVAGVAERVNLERTYFSKIFRQVEGLTPQQYILEYRLGAAKRLLAGTHYTVKEVGELVGMNDVYYFSHAFKKQFGLSPLQYRQRKVKGLN